MQVSVALSADANASADEKIGYGLFNYLKHDFRSGLHLTHDCLCISLESLWKLDRSRPWDILILDEWCSIAERFYSVTTRKRLMQIWDTLLWLLASSKRIVVADADLEEQFHTFISWTKFARIVHPAVQSAPTYKIHVRIESKHPYTYHLGKFEQVQVMMKEAVAKRQRCAIICSNASDAINFAKTITNALGCQENDEADQRVILFHSSDKMEKGNVHYDKVTEKVSAAEPRSLCDCRCLPNFG